MEGSDLSLFVRREHVAEVLGALREAGFSAEEPISHSADPDSVQITIAAIGAAAGTLTALAVVLEKILGRHDRKRLVVNQDGIDATGYSAKDLNQILSALIEGRTARGLGGVVGPTDGRAGASFRRVDTHRTVKANLT